MERWRVALEAQLVTHVSLIELSSVINRASVTPGKVEGNNIVWRFPGDETKPSLAIITKIDFVTQWPYLSQFTLDSMACLLQLFDSVNEAPHGNITVWCVTDPTTLQIDQQLVLCIEPTFKNDVLYIEGAQTKKFSFTFSPFAMESHSLKTLHLRFSGLSGGIYPENVDFDHTNAVTWASRILDNIPHARLAGFQFNHNIPTEFEIDVAVEDFDTAVQAAHHANTDLVMEYFCLEKTNFETTEGQTETAMSEANTRTLVQLWKSLPFGVLRMRDEHIMTSANIAEVTPSKIVLEVRSSRESAIDSEIAKVRTVADLSGINYEFAAEVETNPWYGKSRGLLKQMLNLPKARLAHRIFIPSVLASGPEFGVIGVDEKTGDRLISLAHALGKYEKKPSLLDL